MQVKASLKSGAIKFKWSIVFPDNKKLFLVFECTSSVVKVEATKN